MADETLLLDLTNSSTSQASWIQQPLVENEQLDFLQPLHVLAVGPIASGHRNLHQQIRQTDTPADLNTESGNT